MGSLLKPITEKENSVKKIVQSGFESYWFVFYTYPRAEKVVYKELVNRDYEVFLPMIKDIRVWKNRQKKYVEQVLFPSYIFVNTHQAELYYIAQIPKIVTFVQCAGNPSVIPIEEIEGIKRMLCLDQKISVETNFYKGEKVRILYGPLAGHEGILVKQNGKNRFGIQLKEINHFVSIEIDTRVLEKV